MSRRSHAQAVADFWERLVPAAKGCWVWIGRRNDDGYGVFDYAGKGWTAHRWAWVHLGGHEIPVAPLEIDHLCRNRACVNPAHMEAVTHTENVRRGDRQAHGSHNRRKTHCKHGHPFDEANTYYRKGTGARMCRTCWRITALERYHATKENAR